MITEDYVSFEIAKLLKEKGFDESVNRFYEASTGQPLLVRSEYCRNSYTTSYATPTLQMAMKWLREKELVICIIPLTFYCGEKVNSWGYNIWADDNLEVDEENTPKFATYEEACKAALKYVLENLI